MLDLVKAYICYTSSKCVCTFSNQGCLGNNETVWFRFFQKAPNLAQR